MQLGDILIGRGLVTAADIDSALARQLTEGGRLGDNLIAMELLTAEQLATVINTAPAVPASLEETGISARNLLNLLLKFMLVEGCETLLDLAERLKLPRRAVQQLLDEAVHQKLIQAVGAAPGGLALSIRHALSENGRAAAKEALEQNLYIGPAPVCLSAYHEQILRQRISNEQLDADALRDGFAGLVVPDHYIRKLLPAVNAGRRSRPVSRRSSRMSSISPMPSKPAVRSSGSSIRHCTSPPRPPRPPRRPPGLGSSAKRSISAGSPASGRSW
jgi:hypothetical protein